MRPRRTSSAAGAAITSSLALVLLLTACGDSASEQDTPPTAAPVALTSTPLATSGTTVGSSTTTVAPAPTTVADTTTTTLGRDAEPPTITITAPEDGAVSTSRAVRFVGTAEPGAIVLAWNRWIADVDAEGNWSIALTLSPGTNVAQFSATDAAGNRSVAEVAVTYEPPVSPTTTSAPEAPATVVVTFTPSVVPEEHQEGRCGDTSHLTRRDDAYWCFLDPLIYDPCFDTGDELICGADPISGDEGFVVDLTEPLPTDPPQPGTHPWIIQLADGSMCRGYNGATGAVDGVRLDYRCPDGSWVLGDLTLGDVWTGHRVMMSDGGARVVTDYGFVPLAKVWL